jgi:DNA polymerase-3 subunit alpha
MPDIDVDFSDDKREKVIQYVRDRYGADSVSQIITFGTLSSRAVLKDVGRVLGIPLSTIESITKQIPVELGRVRPLADALETIPDLKWVKDSTDPKITTLVEASLVLEGMNRNAGMHAAGVVIAPGNISEYVPLYKTPQTEIMTQYNMKDLASAGLLKMDFLGLRTLSVIDNALSIIRENHNIEIDLDAIPEDDKKTFDLFSKGDTVGVFQFESSGMRDWLSKLIPSCMSDLVAMNALYRPGPMDMIGEFIGRKHGKQQISYLHPKLESLLKETYGIIVYQEQVIKIASEIAGFTLPRADLMRRAMGKKDRKLMAELKKEFVDGAVRLGTERHLAGEIFDLIEKFASYGFNKSHSVAYSVVAYHTAYLKAHYPAELMAATLSSEIGNTDRFVRLIDDCRKMGIKVLPPDVNESGKSFNVVKGDILFGLCAIKNVGESAIDTVISTRESKGKFENMFDFCRRVDLRLVNKKCLESLVQAGAFDSMGGHRALHSQNTERATQFGQAYQSQTLNGQSSLFESLATSQAQVVMYPTLTNATPWAEGEKLTREKNVLGFYVSGHPLSKFEREIKEFSNVHFGDLAGFKTGATAKVCGVITMIKKKVDKRGNAMAFVEMEDFTGKGECIVFSDAYAKYKDFFQPDTMVMVVGKGEVSGDKLKILVNEACPMDKVREKFTKSVMLSINVNDVQENTIVQLRKLLENNRGNCPCYFNVSDATTRAMYQAKQLSIEPSARFVEELKKMLGPQSVRFNT